MKIVITIFLMLFAITSFADDDEFSVQIHGFGGWGAGKTWSMDKEKGEYSSLRALFGLPQIQNPQTGELMTNPYYRPDLLAVLPADENAARTNNYMLGNDETNYSNTYFTLSTSANPYPNFTIYSQILLELYDKKVNPNLDFAFVEHYINDYFIIRTGRVKQPYGLYNELTRVGTVRSFYELPQSIYGPNGMTGAGFNGVSINGHHYTESEWGFEYDLYYGQIDIKRLPEVAFVMGNISLNDYFAYNEKYVKMSLNHLGGVRFNIQTPFSLKLGVSGYTGKSDFGDQWIYVFGAHTRWTHSGFDFSAEYSRQQNADGENIINSAYAILSYKFLVKYQIALMADYIKIDELPNDNRIIVKSVTGESIPNTQTGESETYLNIPEDILKSIDLGIAFNIWMNPSFAIKLEYHYVDGNFYSHSPMDGASFFYGNFYTKTHLLQGGVQFSF
ncbi:hypothetical protein JXR93_02550 [bacterium]|nr:hypothetical protein [bacterium]